VASQSVVENWDSWKDHPTEEGGSVVLEETLPLRDDSNSDDEILFPRTPSSREGWRNTDGGGPNAEGPTTLRLEDRQLTRDARATRWAEEAAVSEQYVVFGSNLVTYAAGLDIRTIVPGFNLCTLKVKNLPLGTSASEVGGVILQNIPTSNFFVAQVYNVGSTCEAVVLISRQYGHTIVFAFEGIGFRQQVLSFDVSDFNPPNSMVFGGQPPSLSVSWEVMNKPLIVTYRSPEEALRRAGELNGTMWKGHRLRVSVIESHPASTLHSVKITNPPDYAEMDFDFCCFVGSLLVQPSKGMSCDYLESLPIVCDSLRQQKGVLMHTLEVFPVDNGEARIQVNFDSWGSARHAYTYLNNLRPGFGNQGLKLRAWLPHSSEFHYYTNIPKLQYLSQKRLWDAIREGRDGAHEGRTSILVEETDDIVLVSVLGHDQKETGALKVRVENLIAGEELNGACWHPNFLFPQESEPLFHRIYNRTGVFARTDFERHSLRVYGEAGVTARRIIEEEVQRLRNIETTRTLDRGTVAFFIKEGMGRLKELIGEDNVMLQLASRPCTITVKGGQEASHHLQRLIDESLSVGLTDIDEESLCPVCYTSPPNPEYLACGHSYCAGCLKHLLSSAADSKKFPIVCVGNEATCASAFPIPFLHRFLPRESFQHLIEAAFTCYVEQHPQEYRSCPTVDCKHIYRRQQHPTSLRCPSCFLSVCPACSEESHGDLTCEESHFQRDPAMQEMVNEQLGFKKCPNCYSWIEKSGGCNHLQCSCGAHICWRCMGVFNGRSIYTHMNSSHGGIHGEEIPPGLVVGADPPGAFIAEQINALAQYEMERVGRRQGIFNFFGRARFPRQGPFLLDDDLVMMDRRRPPPPPPPPRQQVPEGRRLIPEFYGRRLQQGI